MAVVRPVRDEDDFDHERVARVLSERVPESLAGPIGVWQFPTGASNLTYLLRRGDWSGVLRRPPRGPIPPRAHDMEREHRWLSRLSPKFLLAPRPYFFCGDESLIGAPFYVMEHREGLVIDRELPETLPPGVPWGARISESFIETLGALHALDPNEAGLREFGRPEGFLARQVGAWVERYRRAATDDIPELEALVDWLGRSIPGSPAAKVIHNDFKLNNLIVSPTAPDEVLALVDWEMATVGDPLLDLGVALSYWVEAADPPEMREALNSVSAQPGFFTRRELAKAYARLSGQSIDTLPYYLVFAYFKLAVIIQQIYVRFASGQTTDGRFESFGRRARFLIELAASLAGREELP